MNDSSIPPLQKESLLFFWYNYLFIFLIYLGDSG